MCGPSCFIGFSEPAQVNLFSQGGAIKILSVIFQMFMLAPVVKNTIHEMTAFWSKKRAKLDTTQHNLARVYDQGVTDFQFKENDG